MLEYSVCNPEELAIFKLRELFLNYGFRQYRMNKFEEYDLYVRNKEFLISDGVITFTDTNGKLLALKPDVTLSIVKNATFENGVVEKVFYDENVYRVSSGTGSFKEILQTGVECFGDIDEYSLFEVILLAFKSLSLLSNDYLIDLSHFGILSDVLNESQIYGEIRKRILTAFKEKNPHELNAILSEFDWDPSLVETLTSLMKISENAPYAIKELKHIFVSEKALLKINLLERIVNRLEKLGYLDRVRIDMSLVSESEYYNGIMFRGFIKGIPMRILSGGEYDSVIGNMNQFGKAVGFAIYLDLVEDIMDCPKNYDIDSVLLYNEDESLNDLDQAVRELIEKGFSVRACRCIDPKIRFRELYRLEKGKVELLERNA